MDFNWGLLIVTLGSFYGVIGSFVTALVLVLAHKIFAGFFGERSLPAGFFFLLTIFAVLLFVISLVLVVVNIAMQGWSYISSS